MFNGNRNLANRQLELDQVNWTLNEVKKNYSKKKSFHDRFEADLRAPCGT